MILKVLSNTNHSMTLYDRCNKNKTVVQILWTEFKPGVLDAGILLRKQRSTECITSEYGFLILNYNVLDFFLHPLCLNKIYLSTVGQQSLLIESYSI